MSKKSSALKALEEKRRQTRKPIKVDSIVTKRPPLASRSPEAAGTSEEKEREEEEFMHSLVTPQKGVESTDQETTDKPPVKKAAKKYIAAQRVRDTIVSETTVSPQDTVVLQDTVTSETTVSPQNTVSQPKKDMTLGELLDKHSQVRNGVNVETNFTQWDNSISDYLVPLQTVYEQAVYNRMYRLSWGYHRDCCFVGYDGLVKSCNISKSSAVRAVTGLLEKGHIQKVEELNTKHMKGTIYRVLLPHEIDPKLSQDTVVPENTVSPQSTVVSQDTVVQDTVVSQDTVVPENTIKESTSTLKERREELEPTPVLEASYVRAGNGGSRGLVLKDPNPETVKSIDQEYVYTRSTQQQTEIFEAMNAWERVFPDQSLPLAAKLDEWLQGIRERDSYWKGADLIALFEHALKTTREREPRDVIGWLTAGFREGYLVDPGIFSN